MELRVEDLQEGDVVEFKNKWGGSRHTFVKTDGKKIFTTLKCGDDYWTWVEHFQTALDRYDWEECHGAE